MTVAYMLLTGLLLTPAAAQPVTDRDDPVFAFTRQIQSFFEQHCHRCHGPDTQEGELRLDTLSADFSQPRDAEIWTEVMDRLNAGEMPPEGEPSPDVAEVTRVTEWIAAEIRRAAAEGQSTGGRVVLRRLNRFEYNNTIRDLIGVDFEPGADFPADPPAHGFDNIGAALQVSPLLMEKYLKAAREIVDRAIVNPGLRPHHHRWHMEVDQAHRSQESPQEREADDEFWTRDPVLDHRYIVKGGGTGVRGGMLVHRGTRPEEAAGFRWFKIPVAGEYIIRVRAAARVPSREELLTSVREIWLTRMEQDEWSESAGAEKKQRRRAWLADEWPEIAAHFQSETLYDYGAPRLRVTTDEGVIIGEVSVDAPPEDPQVYEFRHTFIPDPRGTDGVDVTNAYRVPRVLENFWMQDNPSFARPELLIDWVELEGVHVASWPPESHRRILFDSPHRRDERRYAREVLRRFMSRAWRRPLERAEVEQIARLFDEVRPHKRSFEEAIKVPLVAVLTSPHFLYLIEPSGPDRPGEAATAEEAATVGEAAAAGEASGRRGLTAYELASRLSYFLWSSMPDEELFNLAAAGRLAETDTLRAQVDRMLSDSRSQAFVRSFAGQWLRLREVGANPPVENLFPRYDDHLEQSMVRESEAFFAEILHGDLSVTNFLRSDFVTVNERMARFYGIPGVRGDHFRRVDVPEGLRRGGLLTQASILTLTSNGTRTSPVIRGVWILENLLGDPPPPPPPDAGDLAPKVPGIDKATVRDRLQAHRRIPQCAACHQKIDPLGFALENFDAHGLWREKYGFGYNGRVGRDDPPVDARAALPDGTRFEGASGLQDVLLSRRRQFLTCLTEKLMIYALGRGLEYTDRPARDRFVANLQEHGTLRGLIRDIVTSEAFRTK